MRSDHDIIIIGTGINALVCAAMLGLRGKRVLLLERNDRAGGCIRTEELTEPGFLHDTLSTLYPLFVTAAHFPVLEPLLARHGAKFVNCSTPTAVLLPDGQSTILHTDRQANIDALEKNAPGDGAAYVQAMSDIETNAGLLFGMLGSELWSWSTARLLFGEARRRGVRGLARFFGEAMRSSREWLSGAFASPLSKALFAPWVLHVGLSNESTASAMMNKLVLFSLEQAGSPMVAGGSARLVEAFEALINEQGGAIRTSADVDQIATDRGKATGVKLASGEVLQARDGVVASVTPTQLYGRLLSETALPDVIKQDAAAFRYGRGEMQIHLALSEPPQWPDPELAKVAMLHVTPGLEGVSRAVNEAERGLLPSEATIVVAQPVALDPSRAPDGKWIFWIQLQEVPREGELIGDASGQIRVPGDGSWSDDVREAYADRIINRLCKQIPNLEKAIIGRTTICPADLEKLNINLVGGDPYSGLCSIDQFMLWRPFATPSNHRTPIVKLHHIGASTHPGPGLGGMSGFMAAADIK